MCCETRLLSILILSLKLAGVIMCETICNQRTLINYVCSKPSNTYTFNQECVSLTKTDYSQISCSAYCKRQRTSKLIEKLSEFNNFRWIASQWSNCTSICGQGNMYRHMRCGSLLNNYTFPSQLCDINKKPVLVTPCNGDCFNRLTKSKHVAKSKQNKGDIKSILPTKIVTFRPTNDHESNHSVIINVKYGKPTVPLKSFRWYNKNWSQCQPRCNVGKKYRIVYCVNEEGKKVSDSLCEQKQSKRPKSVQRCSLSPTMKNCFELSRKRNCKIDGVYTFRIDGKNAKIYCSDMTSTQPKEYINLPAGPNSNYAEVFPSRYYINHPNIIRTSILRECDLNHSGFTGFNKVALNLENLTVITDDYRYAETRYGVQIPFGQAGACSSKSSCRKGRFSVNLTGTSFTLDTETIWKAYKGSTKQIATFRSLKNLQTLFAYCQEDQCQICGPSSSTGIILKISRICVSLYDTSRYEDMRRSRKAHSTALLVIGDHSYNTETV
ncbi:hypothetical protein GJ496_006635 [Pomphorhynchus laevis]|nr:hypothetical protein GJ496_006635 [Pomphorhynchus laevis]